MDQHVYFFMIAKVNFFIFLKTNKTGREKSIQLMEWGDTWRRHFSEDLNLHKNMKTASRNLLQGKDRLLESKYSWQ